MPKTPTVKHDSATSGPMDSASHPNVLKRNQACHQCRRRKLKCDAQRPCSTCVRSHAHALSHTPAGVVPPDYPECTFDEAAGLVGAPEAPKNRYEKLESRINELEALLKDQNSSAPSKSSRSSLSPPSTHSPNVAAHPGLAGATVPTPSVFHSPSLEIPQSYQSSPGDYPGISTSSTSFVTSTDNPPDIVPTPVNDAQTTTTFLSPDLGYDVYWPGWPKDLPSPALVRHLVEAFFSFHPHASRLFHMPTFMASIDLPPTHPNFPSPAIIHAICAVGSLYTVAVPPTPPPEKSLGAGMSENVNLGNGSSDHSLLADEIFGNWYKQKDYAESFAERHVKLAKQTAEEQLWAGRNLLEDVQAMLIITWWYWYNARWVETFTTIGQAIRAAVPLGIGVNPPFFPISDSLRTPSLIRLPNTTVEDEVRRNTFWLLYAMERMGGCCNGWALCLDDQDVSQLLPMRGVNFDLGLTWTGSERQHALGKDILLHHPEDQVDSFSLYIKGCILLSRVKAYNLRFRSKRFLGDPAYTYASTYAEVWEKVGDGRQDKATDPRRTSGFIEIDHIASMFRQSFPLYLRSPIRDGSVDSDLYTACLTPHLAIILLHDPHAHVNSPGCVSAFKILEASRAVLDLIHAVRSTSFDVTLLDFFCSFCWFMAGRVLVRFWQAAQHANSKEQTLTLRSEIEYIIAALAKLGERVPLAHRYFLMLSDVASRDLPQHS